MTAAEIEQSNKYNAKHYEPFEETKILNFILNLNVLKNG